MSEKTLTNGKAPRIKIYVSCHKETYIPDNRLLYPIQVGTDLADKYISDILHDNTGDNISKENKRYCELTAQYWAWKNEEADYYGFMHYRRFFSFNPIQLEEDCFGNIIMENISNTNLEKLCYDPDTMSDFISKYDVITVTPTNLKDIGKTVYGHYKDFSHDHYIEDYELAIKIIIRDYPELKRAAIDYSNSSEAYFCNMYIMHKEFFDQYNQWLFEILQKHSHERSYEDYSDEEYRISAFLAERLWGIYYTYLKEKKEVRTAELQRTLFSNTEKNKKISPAFFENNIPLIFSSDQNYLPFVATTMQSVSEKSSREFNYDVIILHAGIEKEAEDKFKANFLSLKNFSIRFYNVSNLIETIDFSVNSHFSKENYFRLFIQFITEGFDKVIYLDSDLIVLHDISELMKIEMGDNLVCAVKDVDWIAAYKKYDPERKKYTDRFLHIEHPLTYFNSGVLVYNITQFNHKFSYIDIVSKISSGEWMFVDQDILNILCENKVQYLDMRWNVLTDYQDINYSRRKAARVLPHDIYYNYLQSYKAPYIVHYAGCKKPWDYPESDMASAFWHFARHTGYYEQIIKNMYLKQMKNVVETYSSKNISCHNYEQVDYQGVKIKGVEEPIYVDGIMVKAINKFNRKFPIGSPKRDRLRKLMKLFMHN